MKPNLTDDGTTVTLDVHGADIIEAESMIMTTARLAAFHGRATLRVIHGSSTSDRLYRNRTIKHVLENLLEANRIPNVAGFVQMDGVTIMSLNASGRRSPVKITLFDIR